MKLCVKLFVLQSNFRASPQRNGEMKLFKLVLLFIDFQEWQIKGTSMKKIVKFIWAFDKFQEF